MQPSVIDGEVAVLPALDLVVMLADGLDVLLALDEGILAEGDGEADAFFLVGVTDGDGLSDLLGVGD
jgi:hypothetical protein